MIKKGFNFETQVLSWVLSYDGVHSPDALAITAAGAALALSEVPLSSPVAGVRVGMVGGEFIVNPTLPQMEQSKLDLVLGGTATAIFMIEGYCDFLSEEQMLQAVSIGHKEVAKLCKAIGDWSREFGKSKRIHSLKLPPTGIISHIEAVVGNRLEAALRLRAKKERAKAMGELEEAVLGALTAEGRNAEAARLALEEDEAEELAEEAWDDEDEDDIEDGEQEESDVRVRATVRKVTAPSETFEVGDVKRAIKELPSSTMRRLVVQALAVATLGGDDMGQRLDNLTGGEGLKRFYLQYSFPPSSVGETKRHGGPSRREIGHGMLAERALEPVLPPDEEFPYAIRLESTITESNGSSSMASVCGGCLALLDAGVPLRGAVAGIAMGLILDTSELGGDGEPVILSDILGSEDALGDMDF
eukprot:SM000104S09358  [mRNA]  locus=s104:294786:298459:+ [translate_table: standard]